MAVQTRVAIPKAVSTNFTLTWQLHLVLAVSIIRLVLILVPSHGFDSFAYKHWTWRLVHEPLNQFYADDGQAFPDHLPGDLWLFKLLGTGARFVHPGIDYYGPDYGALISMLAIGFDAILVLALIWIGRVIGGERAGRIAGIAYWCAPAPIFVASIWGQIDGVSTAIAIISLGLAINRRFSLAFMALTLCVLVKPQFALLALPLLVGWWHEDRGRKIVWLKRVVTTGACCLALLATVSAPFGVSLAGEWGRWSLLERIRLAGDTYTTSTLGAHNFWILFDPLNWPPDDRNPWVFGLCRYAVGTAVFTIVVLYAAWILLTRWRGAVTMVLASNILMFGFFLFMTRMHERYLFPVVALSLLLALMNPRYVRYSISIGILAFANISLRFLWPLNDDQTGWGYVLRLGWTEHAWVVQLLAIITMFVFGWLVATAREGIRP